MAAVRQIFSTAAWTFARCGRSHELAHELEGIAGMSTSPNTVTASTGAAQPPVTSPLLRRIPILGYALRCFDEERAVELGMLLANVVMLATLLVVVFGLPAFVMILYAALFVVAGGVFISTLS